MWRNKESEVLPNSHLWLERSGMHFSIAALVYICMASMDTRFQQWCQENKVLPPSPTRTAWNCCLTLEYLHFRFLSKVKISCCVASSYGQCHSSLYISESWNFFFRTQFRSEKHFGGRIAMSALCESSEAPTILGQKWDSLLWVKIDQLVWLN